MNFPSSILPSGVLPERRVSINWARVHFPGFPVAEILGPMEKPDQRLASFKILAMTRNTSMRIHHVQAMLQAIDLCRMRHMVNTLLNDRSHCKNTFLQIVRHQLVF